jgi:hypothetical protein
MTTITTLSGAHHQVDETAGWVTDQLAEIFSHGDEGAHALIRFSPTGVPDAELWVRVDRIESIWGTP